MRAQSSTRRFLSSMGPAGEPAGLKHEVYASLSKQLVPKNRKPPARRQFPGFPDSMTGVLNSLAGLGREYELSADQTIFDLKLAVTQDPTTRAGHLKPESLRVCQVQDNMGEWDPALIRRYSDDKVVFERTDEVTIAECLVGVGSVCVLVDIRPSAWGRLWEQLDNYAATHTWPKRLYRGVIFVTIIFYIVRVFSK